jgi:cytochrome c6
MSKVKYLSLVGLFVVVLLPWVVAVQAADEDGEQVYQSKCAMCHGKDGKSDTKAGQMTKSPDLTQKPWKGGTSLADVEKLLREGVGKMKGYEGKLSNAEISAAAGYVRTLAGVEE